LLYEASIGRIPFEELIEIPLLTTILAIVFAISSRRARAQAQLAHQALHDPLTDLPNRALFADRLEQAVTRTLRYGGSVRVLFMDLDGFKGVNDTLGHGAGDLLLKQVAERIEACLRAGDTVARLGGDEFAVLIENVETDDSATIVARRISKALRSPFLLEGREVSITASIGIGVLEPETGQPEEVLRRADMAMYAAKREGKNRYRIFHPGESTSVG
jgi:diguanylate cyclase (GGDEF)-like protein